MASHGIRLDTREQLMGKLTVEAFKDVLYARAPNKEAISSGIRLQKVRTGECYTQFMRSYVLRKRGLSAIMVKRLTLDCGVRTEPYHLRDSDPVLEKMYANLMLLSSDDEM